MTATEMATSRKKVGRRFQRDVRVEVVSQPPTKTDFCLTNVESDGRELTGNFEFLFGHRTIVLTISKRTAHREYYIDQNESDDFEFHLFSSVFLPRWAHQSQPPNRFGLPKRFLLS